MTAPPPVLAPESPDRPELPRAGPAAPALAALERAIARFEALVARFLAPDLDPFRQTGAVANALLLIVVLSGVALLVWYVPDVRQAHASVAAMDAAPFTAGLVRSLHRYSSDACMLFVIIHALQVLAQRRFAGARWVAWVTGAGLLALLWVVGWLGYWLVWDERAHAVALGSARLLDGLPVFAEPFSRAFLVDETVGSATFFTLFFVHMLIPLAMGIALWLHVTRIARPRLLPGRALTLWIAGSLVLLSLAWPATAAGPAHMQRLPERFSMDWWYLAPIALTDRLSGGALWAIALGAGAAILSVPWTLAGRRPRAAVVDPASCHGCEQCFHDCPFDAIRMAPRPAGSAKERLAVVDPARCIACGICTGSCSTAAIDLPAMRARDEAERLEAMIHAALSRPGGAAPRIAILCAHAIGADVDPAAREALAARLPGTETIVAPCAGWANLTVIAGALRAGAPSVVIVGCDESSCVYRDGASFTGLRLGKEREPSLAPGRSAEGRARLVRVRPGDTAAVVGALAGLAPRRARGDAPRARRGARAVAAALVVATLAAATAIGSDAPYAAPRRAGPELVVSINHPGRAVEIVHDPATDDPSIPVHMRAPKTFERARASVRLRVTVDGAVRLARALPPGGLWGDRTSIAIERIPLTPGAHRVQIDIGDGPDPAEWSFTSTRTIDAGAKDMRVVLFDRDDEFRWR